MPTPPPSIDTVLAALAAALGLSLTVERVLEALNNAFKYFAKGSTDVVVPPLAKVERRADAIVEKYQGQTDRKQIEEQARASVDDNPDAMAAVQGEGEWDERVGVITLTVEPATPPNMTRILREFLTQILGVVAGILLAHGAQLKLFSILLQGDIEPLPDAVDYLLTGILIGGGSAPIHMLIKFLSERRITPSATETNARESTSTEEMPSAPLETTQTTPTPAFTTQLINVPYDGGVDCEKLSRTHYRSADPNMIVLHHTAMHLNSTFDDVVRTIKDRTDKKGNHWITGYHCVILADGSIRPFCRWDRYGNHAVGYNDRSLGLAFNGNFEPNPKIPYANPDGHYGPAHPTLEQLNAGVRVVALWTLLYNIPLDFTNSIIPHRKISEKTCPGTNFPLDKFNTLVKETVATWRANPALMSQLDAYKMKPFLFLNAQVAHG